MRHRVELDCLLLKNREGQRDDSLCGIVDDSLAAKVGMNSDVTGSPLDLLDRGVEEDAPATGREFVGGK